MTPANRKIIDSGGVVPGINNQPVMKPIPPVPPKYIKSKDLGATHQVQNTASNKPSKSQNQEIKVSKGIRR